MKIIFFILRIIGFFLFGFIFFVAIYSSFNLGIGFFGNLLLVFTNFINLIFSFMFLDFNKILFFITNFFIFIYQFFFSSFFFLGRMMSFLFFNFYELLINFLSLFSFSVQDLIVFIGKPWRILQYYITNKFHVAGLGETYAAKVFKYYERVFERHQVYLGPNKYTQMRRIYWIVSENFQFEKTFNYRRSGVLHTQFISQRRTYTAMQENGSDARQFKFLQRFDLEKFRPKDLKRKPYRGNRASQIYLKHNYTVITQSKHLRPYERSYIFPHPGSSWVIEFFVYPVIMILAFACFAFVVEITDFLFVEDDIDGYYEGVDESLLNMDENKEAEISTMLVSHDLLDIVEEDDQYLNNDLNNLRDLKSDLEADSSDRNDVDLTKFYAFRALNYMFNEFKAFSILYPIYRFFILMLPYGWRDWLFLSDSTKVYSYFFQIVLYLPVALALLFFKFISYLLNFFLIFPLFLRIFLFVCFCLFVWI